MRPKQFQHNLFLWTPRSVQIQDAICSSIDAWECLDLTSSSNSSEESSGKEGVHFVVFVASSGSEESSEYEERVHFIVFVVSSSSSSNE